MNLHLDWQWWQIFLGGVATLAIFSFLYRENPFYRFFEHLYIGIATGIGITTTVQYFLWPRVFKPLLGYDRVPFPDGTYAEPYNKLLLLYLIPLAFGCLYYFIMSRRFNWLAQLVIGFSLGVSGGLSFKAVINETFPQLLDSFRPLYLPDNWLGTFGNLVFILTLFSGMTYFFFTFKRRPGGKAEKISATGRYLMMGCFGTFFGSTIMARMALLVERLDFLIHQWWPAIF